MADDGALPESEPLGLAVAQQVFLTTPLGIVVGTFPDMRIETVNRAFCAMLGYQEADLLGRTVADITHPDDLAAEIAAGRTVSEQRGGSFAAEKRYLARDGRAIPVRLTASLVGSGAAARIVGIVEDVTERDAAARALSQSQAQLARALESMGAAPYTWHLEAGKESWWPPEASALLGYEPGEISPTLEGFFALLHPDDHAHFAERAAALRDGRDPVAANDYRLRCRDGQYRWFRFLGRPFFDQGGVPLGVAGTVTNVDTAKRSELRLAENAAYHELLAEIATRVVAVPAAEGRATVEWALERLSAFVGASSVFMGQYDPDDEPPGFRRAWAVGWEGTPPCDAQVVARALALGRLVVLRGAEELRAGPLDGEVLVRGGAQSGIVLPLTRRGPTIDGVCALFGGGPRHDLAEVARRLRIACDLLVTAILRWDAERAVEAERERFRLLAEHIPLFFSLIGRDHRYAFVNRRYEEAFGRTAAEIVGMPVQDLIGGAAYARTAPAIDGALDGEMTTVVAEVETIAGGPRVMRGQFSPYPGESGRVEGALALVQDITLERREAEARRAAEAQQARLERQLQQAQKMEAIGRLAGGIAHDFNNLLQVVIGHASFLLDGLAPGSAHRGDVEPIMDAAERASRLVRQLLTFSRQRRGDPRSVDLGALLKAHVRMVGRLIGEDVHLELDVGNPLPEVWADPGQIEQVLMNLCVNARDAMPLGGTLTIGAEVVAGAGLVERFPRAAAATYVRIWVRDTGVGMTEDIRSRVFDPFFTTKEPGRGTGLGLATVYGIAEDHHGFVDCASAPGRGSTFELFLPVDGRRGEVAEELARALADPGGNEVLLLAEDEHLVRSMAASVLRAGGATVLEAEDGEAAVRLFDRHAHRIDLVVLDVIMPGRSGADVALHVAGIRPDLPVLFCSGYDDALLVERLGNLPPRALLAKPFLPADLRTRVRELLDQKRATRV